MTRVARPAPDCTRKTLRFPKLSAISLARNAGADLADNARTANPAIAMGVLGQVLLVIGFGEIKRSGLRNLRGDGAIALRRQRLLVGCLRVHNGVPLCRRIPVDRRTVLRSRVIALA